MHAGFIVNPASGRAAPGARLALARRLLASAGVDAEVHETRGRGHAAELGRAFVREGRSRVVVWGGDGTINEAAGPLIGTGVVLGIVRAGSGDGLARGLRIPAREDLAVGLALSGTARAIDVGWLGDRHFLNIAGVGFDAAVAAAFNRRLRRGARGYLAEVWTQMWSYRCLDYAIVADGQAHAGRRFLIAFANGREYGTGLVLAPDADVSDGRLNLVLVAGGTPLRQLWRARRLGWRPLAPAEGIHRERVSEAIVRGDHLQCHVDGETFEASGELPVSVQAGALHVAVMPAR